MNKNNEVLSEKFYNTILGAYTPTSDNEELKRWKLMMNNRILCKMIKDNVLDLS